MRRALNAAVIVYILTYVLQCPTKSYIMVSLLCNRFAEICVRTREPPRSIGCEIVRCLSLGISLA